MSLAAKLTIYNSYVDVDMYKQEKKIGNGWSCLIYEKRETDERESAPKDVDFWYTEQE